MGGQCKKHLWKDDGFAQGYFICEFCGTKRHQGEITTRELVEYVLMLVREMKNK
jgi:hypothetical protein